ncbi:MAG TPA: peptidylprolyl isomerase [Bryobacteraceae bacterium]|nr:peptidylprolyl isomerase [Bryobacteraceae bacterium]
MPWIVNGQPVPEDLIQQESAQIARDPRWKNIADEGERAKRLRAAAEHAAQDKMLISQAAARDLRPVDPGLVAQQVARIKKNGSCRSAFDDTSVRQVVEHSLRVERLTREMVESAPKPTAEEVEAFHRTNRENFRMPEMFHAAHIVKHVNEEQSEEQAEAGIQAALADLERGVPFAEAAEIHSDCKGNGGDLGQFPPGHMVEEFEAAISALQPGERTGIFTTPFGFHIAELRAKVPGGPASFEDVRADIEAAFTMRNQQELYLRAVAEMRSKADIRLAP